MRAPVSLPLAEIVDPESHSRRFCTPTPACCRLCARKRGAGICHITPALVWSTSEPLLPEVRAMVEATWNVPVANGWAASESNGGAFCCPVGPGFHIGEDLNIIEPIDEHGNPVPAGIGLPKSCSRIFTIESCRLSATRLPTSSRSPPARCGSAFLKVADVHGRADDVFRYASGIRVHPLNFRSPLGKDPAIVGSQVRQTERGAEIAVVARATVNIEALRSILAQRLSGLGLCAPEVIVRRVDRIERQGAGKLKRFIPLPTF